MKKMLWSKSIWFFDVDDTLVNTASPEAMAAAAVGIAKVFKANYGTKIAESVQGEFIRLFNLAVAGYRVVDPQEWKNIPGGESAIEELHRRIDALQPGTIKKYGKAKKWSREIFIKIASQNVGVDTSAEVILEAADAYWMTLAEECKVFPDALRLFREIEGHNRPIFLITGSDARLRLDKKGEFVYEPEVSEALKRERIEILRNKGINFKSVSIGDPIDKPHKEFYLKGVKNAQDELGDSFSFENSIMVGDSYKGDLQVPKDELGFGMVVLYQPGDGETVINDDKQITVPTLSDITTFLE